MTWQAAAPQGVMPWQGNPSRINDSGIYGPSASIWEQAILAVWFYVTFINDAGDEIILYPIAAFFTAAYVLLRQTTVPLTLKCWPILLLPAVALLSTTWAGQPGGALRFGMMMSFTAMIIIYIASRFAVHEIIRSVFFAGLVTVILIAPAMSNFEAGGPWGEKNIFAERMAIIMIAAMGIAFNKYEPVWLRLLAAPFIPITFLFIVIAESVTALIYGGVAVIAMTGVWLFWSRLAAIRHLRTVGLGVIGLALLCAVLYVLNMPHNTLFEDFVTSFGKDTTLTGRTMLWDAAQRITQERPLLGVGADSFWLWGRGDANTLLELSYKEPGTVFSFHNSYLEVQVHFGIVGLTVLVFAVAWCLYRSAVTWLQTQSVVRSFCLLMTAIMFIGSFTESKFYSVLDASIMLFYLSAVTSIVRRDALDRQNEMLQAQAQQDPGTELFDPAYGLGGAE